MLIAGRRSADCSASGRDQFPANPEAASSKRLYRLVLRDQFIEARLSIHPRTKIPRARLTRILASSASTAREHDSCFASFTARFVNQYVAADAMLSGKLRETLALVVSVREENCVC